MESWRQQFERWIEETHAEIEFLTGIDPIAVEARNIMGQTCMQVLLAHKRACLMAWREDLD
jgi:hypothetical protein